jgi:hypothetical protein
MVSSIDLGVAARKESDHQPGNTYWQQGGSTADASSWLYDYFYKSFGRAPTNDEMGQLLPIYVGADPHITDVAQGNAAVARYHQQQNPNDQFEKDAPGQYETVNGLFKQYLGRDASQQEKDHFGQLLASKQYDPYTIGQVLQTLPENVKKQDEAMRQGLGADLQKQDAQYYNEQIMPGIAQNFAKQGRSFDSSAYAQALAQAAQGQNRQRESFLSNLTAQQYGNNQANARQDYLGNYQYTQNRSNQLADANTSRLYDVENYNMQKQAYDQYLSRYGKRSNASGIGSLVGGLAGMGGAFATGHPEAAGVGYGIGSGLGGGFGSFF